MTTQLSIPENALSEKEASSFAALTFTTRATLRTLSKQAENVPEKMYEEVARLGLNVAGPMQWIYTGASGADDVEFLLEIALPITQPGQLSDAFEYKVFPAFRCMTYTFTGPWSDFHYVYAALFGQFRAAGYLYNDQVREVYSVVNFENPEACETEIQIGLG